jgi:hypothetical protein
MVTQVGQGSSGRGRSFSSTEDVELCRSWIAISQDPVTGTGQSSDAFWKKVRDHFCLKPGVNPRPFGSLNQHYRQINEQCARFIGIRTQIENRRISGASKEDIFNAAMDHFHQTGDKKPFKFQACLSVLEECPKWRGSTENHDSPSSNGSTSVPTTPTPNERPIGNKKAKRKLNEKDAVEVEMEIIESLKQKNKIMEECSALLKQSMQMEAAKIYFSLKLEDVDDDVKDHIRQMRKKYVDAFSKHFE